MPAPPTARVLRWLVPLVLLALCATRNLPWRLSDYDQAKQAFAALELADGGDLWFQHAPGFRGLATKPPLLAWASTALHAAGLPWEAAWRLPSFLATIAVAWMLWRAGATLWPAEVGRPAESARRAKPIPRPPPLDDRRADRRGFDAQPGGGLGIGFARLADSAGRPTSAGSWLAVGIFGLNLLTPRLATLARTDMTLTLWTTTAGLLVWHRRRAGGPWTPGERWSLFAALTAGMLTKGPIILAFLLPGFLECGSLLPLCPRPSVKETDKAGASSRAPKWPWLLPLAVFAAWAAAGCGTVPGFREQVVNHEFLGRFDYSATPVHNRQPVWFYAAALLARLGPWSLLLVTTTLLAPPAWRATWRDPAGRWLIAWTAGGLLLMSLVPSKRPDRILPVIPPLALLLTAVIARSRETSDTPRLETLAAWTTAAALAFTTTATVYEIHKAHRRHENALDHFARAARHLAAAHGWRPVELAVGPRVDESDDTLLVCLRRLRWLEGPATLAAWRTGSVDALVMRPETLATLRPSLGPGSFTVATGMEDGRAPAASYVLVIRPPAGSP